MEAVKPFIPNHIKASTDDFLGNGDCGRYILLPGSDGRAKMIAEYFDNLTVNTHARGHHLYLGQIKHENKIIEVAAISSGMGCPSMEIILHELFHLGAKRFLRIGTAGSLQADSVKIGDIVNAQAAVRDEKTTSDYAPIGLPAIASFDFVASIAAAAHDLDLNHVFHTGIVHCKSSLYAKEFGFGPNADNNLAYLDWLTRYGVLASEMETAALFIQSQYYHHLLMQQAKKAYPAVLCAAILGIISISDNLFASKKQEKMINKNLIELAFQAIKLQSNKDNKA